MPDNVVAPPWSRPLRIPEGVTVCHADPPYARAAEKGSWRLSFILSRGVPPGTPLHLQVWGGRNNKGVFASPQVEAPGADGYVAARTAAGVPLPLRTIGHPGTLAFEAPPEGLREGALMTVVLGDRSAGGGGIEAPSIRDLNKACLLYLADEADDPPKVWGPETWHRIVAACTMHILGGPVAHVRAYVPSQVRPGVPFDVLVRPEDDYSNLASEPVEGLAVYLGEAPLPAAVERVADSTCLRARVTLEEEGVHRLRVVGLPDGWETTTNPTVCRAASPGVRFYWGMIHGHTEMSDGAGSLEHYFRQMRDEAALDFGAPGDHDHRYETPDAFWHRTCAAVKAWNAPGRFVTFLGYEWAKWRRNGDGDRNVYYLHDDRPMYRSDDESFPRPPDLFAALRDEEALVIPHHTGHSGNFCDWKDHDAERERLVEIYQFRGSYECAPEHNPVPERRGSPPYEPGYVRRALRLGWRVGFTAGGDDHVGHAGTEYPIHWEDSAYKAGLTCVLAEEMTRKALWEALRARRVVATTGARLLLVWGLAGYSMGAELALADHPDLAEGRELRIAFHGTAPLAHLDVVRNGEVAHRFEGDAPDAAFAWRDTAPLAEVLLPPAPFCGHPFCYYYVRAVQADGEVAWASPIWIDAPAPAGSASDGAR